MASVRKLKKDVKQWVSRFIQECCTYLAYSPALNHENVIHFIADSMAFEREMIKRICSLKRNPAVEAKKYFQEVREYYTQETHSLASRFDALP